jgi:hypothetical protein
MRQGRRWVDVALVAAFLLALGAPALDWILRGIPPRRRLPEERMSRGLPAAPTDLAGVIGFSSAFEAWFEDSLGWRAELLRLRSRLSLGLFGISPTNACVIGRDGWIFLTQDKTIEAGRGTWPMSASEIERFATALEARRRFCAEEGCEYLFVLVPDKPSVYADHLPPGFARVGPSRREQLAARMAGDASFLDLSPALHAARAVDTPSDHAFFRYGSHWTDRGTAAAVAAIVERLRENERFESVAPFASEDFVWWPEPFEVDSWAARLYLDGILAAPEPTMGHILGPQARDVPAESAPPTRLVAAVDDPALPRILVFHDSFGIPVQKFVARRAERSVCLWGQDFSPEMVKSEKPDLVIELYVDRVLMRPPMDDLADRRAALREAFAKLAAGWSFDPARDAGVIGARGDVDLARTEEGLRVVTRGRAQLELPAAAMPGAVKDGARVVLSAGIVAEAAGQLLFFYRTEEDPEYSRRHAVACAVETGENELFLDLSIPGIRGPILFGAEIGGRPYTIRSLEVRRAP